MRPGPRTNGAVRAALLAAALLAAAAVATALVMVSRNETRSSAGFTAPTSAISRAARTPLREALALTATAVAPTPTPEPTPTPPPPSATAASRVAGVTGRPSPRPPAPPPPPPPAPPQAPQPALDSGLAAELLALVNAERTARGLIPLSVHPALATSSTTYALLALQLDWHEHTGPDGRTFIDRIRAAGFGANVYLGEVMGWGWNGWSPRDILQSWLQSPPHSQVVLNPAFSLAGAGCAVRHDPDGRRIQCVIDLAGQ